MGIYMCKQIESCTYLKEFLTIELDIFKRNLPKHKWFRHIEDDNEALQSFIHDYAGIIKDMYCHYMCPEKGCSLKDKDC